MEQIKVILVVVSLFVIMGCPYPDECCDSTITIINNSQNDIVPWESYSDSDTTISFVIPDNAEKLLAGSVLKIEGNFINIIKKGTKMRLFLFSKDTIDQVPWERIRAENLVLRRYDLTLEDLEALNWTIEYP